MGRPCCILVVLFFCCSSSSTFPPKSSCSFMIFTQTRSTHNQKKMSNNDNGTSDNKKDEIQMKIQATRFLLLERDNARDLLDQESVDLKLPSRKKRKLMFVKRTLTKVFPMDVNKTQYDAYLQATSEKSVLPKRKFCSICGYQSSYTCTRCGQCYCSVQCHATHEDTRCLKSK